MNGRKTILFVEDNPKDVELSYMLGVNAYVVLRRSPNRPQDIPSLAKPTRPTAHGGGREVRQKKGEQAGDPSPHISHATKQRTRAAHWKPALHRVQRACFAMAPPVRQNL
jgi:hypothetical protein